MTFGQLALFPVLLLILFAVAMVTHQHPSPQEAQMRSNVEHCEKCGSEIEGASGRALVTIDHPESGKKLSIVLCAACADPMVKELQRREAEGTQPHDNQ